MQVEERERGGVREVGRKNHTCEMAPSVMVGSALMVSVGFGASSSFSRKVL